MECRLHRVVEFGALGSEFVVGEIVEFHFREGLYRDGEIETAELRPVCRLGGPNHATLGPIVTFKPIALTPRSAVAQLPRE
jgi:flavin reductase (DIM6/NTAB) family NADH-FMN oxidoreductase RutF